MGLTEDEFNNFIKPTVVAPHKPNFNSNKGLRETMGLRSMVQRR